MSPDPGTVTPLQAEDRHRAILAAVQARGSVTVRELAQDLGVAAVTVRVDVRELARRGLIGRVHGGATRLTSSPEPTSGPSRSSRSGPPDRARPERPADDDAERGRGPTVTIGVVVPHASYYYPAVVRGARSVADDHGAKLVLGVSQNDVEEERALVARLLRSGVAGLVLATRSDPQQSPDTEAWLRSLPVPVVLAERRVGWQCGTVEHVATDHEQGAFDAVAHLAALGRKRIGLLWFPTITAPRLRAGFEAALSALDLPPVSPDVPQQLEDDTPAELESKARSIARAVRGGALDALVVHHDVAALPLVGRLRADGIEVPTDLAVVSYDDELAALADPPLTAVAPPREEVGATAVAMLLERLDDLDRPLRQQLIRPALNVRDSCGGRETTQEPTVEAVVTTAPTA